MRRALAAVGIVGLLATFLWGATGLPGFGTFHGDAGMRIAAATVPERRATNAVAAVNFDYRGLDTLGEEFILFASVIASAAVLRRHEGERDAPEGEAGIEREPPQESDAVRLVGLGMVVVLVSFGLYMVEHGQVSAGGGFQGGVILATTPLVVFLCAGVPTLLRIAPSSLTKLGESAGAAGYALVGLLGLAVHKAFLENVLPLGIAGDAWSAGTMLLLNLTVGLAVGAGFTELLVKFLEKLIRHSQGDQP